MITILNIQCNTYKVLYIQYNAYNTIHTVPYIQYYTYSAIPSVLYILYYNYSTKHTVLCTQCNTNRAHTVQFMPQRRRPPDV